jgi:hypothetical protein
MKLNWFGRLAMNSPARAAAQRRYTAERMMRLGGDLSGRVLKPGGRYFFEAITRPLFRQSMRIAMETLPLRLSNS